VTVTQKLRPPRFNLLHEPWIPALQKDGTPDQVSLLQLLCNARDYSGLSHQDPLVVIALYRFLLAFLHRALDGPEDIDQAAEWFEEGFPKAKVEAYAQTWQSRFDLFHPEYPFFQHPELNEEKFIDHWSRLSAPRGSFNTNFLYNYDNRDIEDSQDEASPQEAVLQLLAHQSFALGGLTKRFVTSAKASLFATSCLTVVLGADLHETLCLNLVSYGDKHNSAQDQPCWEQALATKIQLKAGVEKAVTGLTQAYTWVARSIRLRPLDSSCVQTMYYAEGVSPDSGHYRDPMITFVRNKKGELYPLSYREGRGLWRDLHSFIPGSDDGGEPPVVDWASRLLQEMDRSHQPLEFASFGMINNKAKIQLARHEQLRLPPLALKESSLVSAIQSWAQEAQEQSFQLLLALKSLASSLISQKRNGAAPRDISALAASFQADARYWPAAERLFWAHLDTLPSDRQSYYEQQDSLNQAWSLALHRLKHQIFREITNTLEPTAAALRAINKAYLTLQKGTAKK
jgi:CRISPR system Cascade subunit CasA